MDEGAAHRIIEVGAGEVDRVEGLWRGLIAHHDAVVGGSWRVREAGSAWDLRRAQYVEWLLAGNAWMLLAMESAGDAALGYAVVSVHPPGPTFDLGDLVGDLESLAVAPEARGLGVGSALIEGCREILRGRGVRTWGVSLVEGNIGALRLYEREGFKPASLTLLAPVDTG